MSILVNTDTKLVVQGITGREGGFHAGQMLSYGTNVVAGVTPLKGGQTALDGAVPVYDTCAGAVAATGANTSVIFVPAFAAPDAIMEAVDAGIETIFAITEHIPALDMIPVVAEVAARHAFIFTLSELMAVTDAFQRVQSGALTSEEFDKFLSLSVKSKDFFPFIENVVSMTYKGFKHANAVASNSPDNTLAVVRFMERSESDVALRAQLVSILGGDGNISNPAELDAEEASALGSDCSKQIVELGGEHGFRFTLADLSAVVGAFQLVNDGELSMESCARILGLGNSSDGLASVEKTAGRIYRGVRY